MPVVVFASFLLRRISVPNRVQTQRNFLVIFSGQEDIQRVEEVSERGPEVGSTHHGTQEGPAAPWWVMLTSVASRTASSLYKDPNIPETLGESTKINSSRHKFQNHQIQSRHHHGGVHHVHWCLSDDA